MTTVRTAALIGGPASLRLLGSYAKDRRQEIQQELINTWDYYDPTEYADEVLANFPAQPGLDLWLFRPRQWKPIIRLGNLRSLIVEFPSSIGTLAADGLPAAPLLSLFRLTGVNDLGVLAASCELSHLRELVLATNDHQAVLNGLDALATCTGLRRLQLVGWRSLPQLAAASLPVQLRSLSLEPVPVEYNLTCLVDHGLTVLSLSERPGTSVMLG
ncbi:hypothetical protein ACQPW1_13315 [Nocardia sp. CA-128927]|uniref:hypothetical protein n=1 Tax=Nocardia sp. CA-128927 TaxID=3239975 RepID=UPI003D97F9C1